MTKFSYVVTDEVGIHGRPAGVLVKKCSEYKSAITIACKGKSADAKRIMGVMSLGIPKGAVIKITAEGLDEEQAFQIAKNFGGGMKRGATCGVVSAGLMVLGLLGKDNPTLVREFYQQLKEKHQGQLECATLLQMNKEQGGQKKPHCDGMVFEVVELLEELLSKE